MDEEKHNFLIEGLFRPYKTIRDAVHGDIKVSLLETKIIDTSTFQRLRGLSQLGTTSLVYPCARHSRFEHSIGALFMATKIIDNVMSNVYNEIPITNYDKLLIRLCALLHDVNNIPFGHTLEDEGNLFPSQWKDKERFPHFFGKDKKMSKAISDDENLKKLANAGFKEFSPNNVIKDIQKIFYAIESEDFNELKKPFIADIVGNTLCSDLLDYIKRDYYFTGLQGNYDERFLSFIYIDNVSVNKEDEKKKRKKPRLVLRLSRPKSGRMRRDVLSEILHLLIMRYSLAEKVYYHHTKIASSAMIISATNDMKINHGLEVKDLYVLTDETFLKKLIDCEN